MDRPVALVQANMGELKKLAEQRTLTYSSEEELCVENDVVRVVLADLNKCGTTASLGSNEKLVAIALISGLGPASSTEAAGPSSPWTAENSGLTASNKLNRKKIESFCNSLLEDLKAKATS